jgi:YegS/Rv2252/BmrU family lipid kinase
LPSDSIRWLVIVNPASGRPDGGAGWRGIERALHATGLSFDSLHTRHPGHGETLARQAIQDGRRHLLAVGGDGSVNEVVQGVMTAGLSDTCGVTLAVAPTGTGNDWARSLGIGRDPLEITRALATGRTLLHDVGAIDFPASGAPRRWFINVAGAGYDAWVTERVPRPVPSAFTYLRIALAGLVRYRSPHFRITADGQQIEGRLLLAFVANGRYCGNRMNVAPTARMDDGLFDLLAVDDLSLLQVLPKLAKLYGGRILGDPAVRHLRSAEVRIETDPPVSVQADGQVQGPTPAQFSLRRRALTVVTGPGGPSPAGAATRAANGPRSG